MQPTARAVWGITLPLIFAGIGETAVEITDAMFLAHYGTIELGAVAIADALLNVAMFPLAGLIDGIQIMMSRRAGQGRPVAVGAVFNQGFYLLTIASIVLTALLALGGPYLTALLVQSSEVQAAVDDYVGIVAFSIFFQALNFACSAFCTSIGRTRVLVAATLVLVTTNIFLDYALIFGHFGFAELGIRGAAIGTLCAEIAGFAVLFAHVFICGHHREHHLFRLSRWNQGLTRRIGSLSWPVSIDALIDTMQWFAFFVIVERFGERELATANIVYSCIQLYAIVIGGFAETACSMVSNLVGQRRPAAIRPLLLAITSRCALMVLPLAIVALGFPELCAAIFTDDPAIVDGTILALRLATLGLVTAVPASMLVSAIVGLGRTDVQLAIEVAETSAILLCAAAVVLLGLRAELVWLTELIGSSVCLVLAWLWLRARWRDLERSSADAARDSAQ